MAIQQQISSGAGDLGTARGTAGDGHPLVSAPPSPPASRAPGRTWKDPRLLVGIAIVAICVLLGARLLASADDTVAVWAVRADMTAGSKLTSANLQPQRLRFGSSALATSYVSADTALPGGLVLTRDVTAGELLPRAALGHGGQVQLAELPLAVPTEAVPASLRAGELVDVWVTPEAETRGVHRAVLVLEQVRVLAVPAAGSALGPSTTRQVLVGIPEGKQSRLPSALAELSAGSPVLVRRD